MKFILPLVLLALSSVNAFAVGDYFDNNFHCNTNKEGYSLTVRTRYSRGDYIVGNSPFTGFFAAFRMEQYRQPLIDANFVFDKTNSITKSQVMEGNDQVYSFVNPSFQEIGLGKIEPDQTFRIIRRPFNFITDIWPEYVIVATPPNAKKPIYFMKCTDFW